MILLALLMMVWVIHVFRPHRFSISKNTYGDEVVAPLDSSQVGNNILINGQNPSEFVASLTTVKLKSLQVPATWSLSDIKSIQKHGTNPSLFFQDGSSIQVTPLVLKELPGNLQVRVSYER